jgi:hypothetical protein
LVWEVAVALVAVAAYFQERKAVDSLVASAEAGALV